MNVPSLAIRDWQTGVTDGHEVRLNLHGRHLSGLLAHIEADGTASQRHLSRQLGIALGLTNLLLRRIVARGWVKVVQLRPNRVRYLLTPAGMAAKARLTREYLQGALTFYVDARDRVRERLDELSADLARDSESKRIVFFGLGEIAEIAYVSLQHTDLELVAVVSDGHSKTFFGLPVHPEERLHGLAVNGQAFARLVVMSFEPDGLAERLSHCEVPAERVFWL